MCWRREIDTENVHIWARPIGGCSASLDVLNKYPTFQRIPLVSSDHWLIIHGNTPAEVEQALEGIYTLEVMAKDIAWLMKCI